MAEPIRFTPRNQNSLKTAPRHKLIGRIRLSEFIELGEKEFRETISSCESDPLFAKLFSPGIKAEKSITYSRPHRLKLSERMLEFKDGLVPAGQPVDVEPLLAGREKASGLIREIGEEKFKKYFLFNEAGIDKEEIARACGIEQKDVAEILALVNDLAALEEFYERSAAAREGGITYSAVAAIEKDANGGFSVVYRYAHLAKGRYSIDYEKIEAQKKRGLFSAEELARLGPMLKQLEAINIRKTVLHGIMENIIEFQKEYLDNGEKTSLAPLNQKTVAKRLGVNPSLVSRAAYAKSLLTPSGRETPVKEFFPSKKDVVKALLEKILVSDKKRLKDEVLSSIIMDKHGFKVSRHLVQIYRSELGLPPAGKRAPREK